MINRLRNRFISIAMTSVVIVIFLLLSTVDVLNYYSGMHEMENILTLIEENQGGFPDRFGRGYRYTEETPYQTRYFVIKYGADGLLHDADMTHIASVDWGNIEEYLTVAFNSDLGMSKYGNYVYRVSVSNRGYTAIFMDATEQFHSFKTYALLSLVAGLVCIGVVYFLIFIFSKKAVNPMVENMRKQKEFITNASHELKTPLTVIATSQKVLEMDVGKQKWIDKTQNQVDIMRKLVDELVKLCRMEEEPQIQNFMSFDASLAVSEVAESYRELAEQNGLDLEIQCTGTMEFVGEQYALRELVTILLDNAMKYATPEGPVEVRLSPVKKGLELRVSNTCPPFDKEELKQIFERFYRSDKSHSKQKEGFGIGLSIARSIAERFGGNIRAEKAADNKIVFIAVLYNQKTTKTDALKLNA